MAADRVHQPAAGSRPGGVVYLRIRGGFGLSGGVHLEQAWGTASLERLTLDGTSYYREYCLSRCRQSIG